VEAQKIGRRNILFRDHQQGGRGNDYDSPLLGLPRFDAQFSLVFFLVFKKDHILS